MFFIIFRCNLFICSETLSCHKHNSCSVSINCSVFFCSVSLHKIIANCIVKIKVTESCPTLCHPLDYTICGILWARILEWVAFPSSRASSQPRVQIQVSCIAGGFFTAEPQGKPKNTGVGSLSLLQRIFLTHKLNWVLLHCRQILYQLSNQGGP